MGRCQSRYLIFYCGLGGKVFEEAGDSKCYVVFGDFIVTRVFDFSLSVLSR